MGLPPEIATGGREAVEAVIAQPFDLILMACQMSKLSGWDAAAAIRRLETLRQEAPCRILGVCEAEATQEVGLLQHCSEARMDDFLSKPLDFRLLQEAVSRWLPEQCNNAKEAPAPSSRALPRSRPISLFPRK
jgi:CheY-like chemotaxis protein